MHECMLFYLYDNSTTLFIILRDSHSRCLPATGRALNSNIVGKKGREGRRMGRYYGF